MRKDNFINFLDKLNIEPKLLEAILGGYKAVFTESVDGWSANGSPFFPFPNAPYTSKPMANDIIKTIPSPIGAVGSAGDNTRMDDKGYKYGPALPGSTRDMKEETVKEWEDAPNFPTLKKTPAKNVKKIMNSAKTHIPNVANNMNAPINYYSNFHLGMYNVDTNNPPF